MTRQIVVFGFIALAACATDTRRQEERRPTEQAGTTEGAGGGTTQVDQDFVQKAASGGMFEVESARLALSRQGAESTTDVAQTLMRDHSQANDRLMQLAQQKGIEVPQQMLPEDEQKLEQLRSAEGQEFTEMFEQIQEQTHRESIALFERCAQYCQDMDIREFAASTLPTLRDHMREIEQAQATARREQRPEERAQQQMERERERMDRPETPNQPQ